AATPGTRTTCARPGCGGRCPAGCGAGGSGRRGAPGPKATRRRGRRGPRRRRPTRARAPAPPRRTRRRAARRPLRGAPRAPHAPAHLKGHEPERVVCAAHAAAPAGDALAGMIAADVGTLLPDDFLVKVDRASMAHGLEVRPPLLDHELFELAARVPSAWKV